MYNFIDTNQVSEGGILPSEALKINGAYIEDQIAGYRTLNVKGREALSPDVVTYTTGIRDGSRVQNKRFPERIITVTYQIIADSNEAFRAAYNKLGSILNVEEAELIFNDEQDKFFIGTPCIIGEVSPGMNSVVGEFEILCADPFKYSITEYTATLGESETSILLDYNGTYKSYPTLEADFFEESEVADDGETETALTGSGDCGYVAFFNENEKIIQLGDPDEVDKVIAYPMSQQLMGQLFQYSGSWGTAAQKGWTFNKGHILPSDISQSGTLGMDVTTYEAATVPPSTSGTLLQKTSNAEAPPVVYTVTAKTSGRTADSIKVNVAISAALGRASSYFKKGYSLKASLYIGGAWHSVVLKKTAEIWEGTKAHTVNLSVTVKGLQKTTSVLTGIKFKAERTDSTGGKTGILSATACNNLPISQYRDKEPSSYYLHSKFDTKPTSAARIVGTSMTRTIPADKSGEVGAANFTMSTDLLLCIGNDSAGQKQAGGFQLQLSDAAGNNIAGVRIVKNKAGRTGTAYFYVNGKAAWSGGISLAYNDKYFGAVESASKTFTIKKSGASVSFAVGSISKTIKDTAIKDVKAAKITYMFECYYGSAPLFLNGITGYKFIKNNCETLKDIPNKFTANDVLKADCRNGEILLNGISSPELGALGNDWEEFYLKPGINQIGVAYSEWVKDGYAPVLKVRYREVFL